MPIYSKHKRTRNMDYNNSHADWAHLGVNCTNKVAHFHPHNPHHSRSPANLGWVSLSCWSELGAQACLREGGPLFRP